LRAISRGGGLPEKMATAVAAEYQREALASRQAISLMKSLAVLLFSRLYRFEQATENNLYP